MKTLLQTLRIIAVSIGVTTTVVLMSGTAQALALPSFTVADAKSDACTGVGLVGSGGACGDQGAQFSGDIKTGINIFSVVIGIMAVVMIIIAGVRFVTSGGDSGKVAGAKSAVIYAIIGLVLVIAAQSIVWFVLFKV